MKKSFYIIIFNLLFLIFTVNLYAGWITENIQSGNEYRWPSLAIGNDDSLHLVYFDSSYSEIGYVWKNQQGSWDYAAPILLQGSGINGQVSMALDNFNIPHVSYIVGASNELFCSLFDGGNWYDLLTFMLENNKHTSIVLDSNNPQNIHISFQYNQVSGGLKYTTDYASWPNEDIQFSAAQGNSIGKGSSIDITQNNFLYVSYIDESGPSPILKCKYKHIDDTVWFNAVAADPDSDTSPKGGVTSLVLVNGNPHIVYSKDTAKVMYVYLDNFIWQGPFEVDSSGSKYISMDITTKNDPHIVYYDLNSRSVKYARRDVAGWKKEVIASDAGDYGGGSYRPSIKLDSLGNPHIVYFDSINRHLIYAETGQGGGDISDPISELKVDEVVIGNNKFDPATGERCRIMYNLSRDQNVTIDVYDLSGSWVKTIVDNEIRSAGKNGEDVWNGDHDYGFNVPSGIYYIVVEGEDFQITKKVAVVKSKNK